MHESKSNIKINTLENTSLQRRLPFSVSVDCSVVVVVSSVPVVVVVSVVSVVVPLPVVVPVSIGGDLQAATSKIREMDIRNLFNITRLP